MSLPFGEFYTDLRAEMPDGSTIEQGGGPWSTRTEALASLAALKRKLKAEGGTRLVGRVYKERR